MSVPRPGANPATARWLIVALLTGLVFLAHFNRVSISVAANAHFIGPEKLSEQQMGLVYSAFLFVYTLGMLPGGYALDRVGPRRALTAMGVGLGFWAALTGVLGWSGLSIPAMLFPLLAVRGLAGATSVPLHPGAARAVSLWVPVRDRSTANGLVTAGALVGIALTYPVFGRLMDRVGWQSAFVVCGATLGLFALVWHALAADAPAEHRRAVSASAGAPAALRAYVTLREAVGLLRNRSLVLLTLSYGALGYVQYMFFYWIEYYFSKELKLPESESRRAAFIVTLAMAGGMVLGGWVSDRLCRAVGLNWGCRAMAVAGMVLSAGFSLLGVATTDPQEVTWWFALALGSLGMCEGIFWTTAPALAPRTGGLACALVNTGGNGVGMLAPVVTPLLGQHYGWATAVAVACGICAAGGLLWFGITPAADDSHRSGADMGR
ncbi:MAG TPA: MFS transporter [Urbifossiella sp.]|jgi:MFS family permease|nr:MFS transporter [Urbifossiella sp.]